MIFVDDLISYGTGFYRGDGQAKRVGSRNGHEWCHLFSDEQDPTFPDLHAFARKIGMKREWFQGDHYDLTPGRRSAAVANGAHSLDRAAAVAIWRSRPRARRFRCKTCGHTTERTVAPPAACPKCAASPDRKDAP